MTVMGNKIRTPDYCCSRNQCAVRNDISSSVSKHKREELRVYLNILREKYYKAVVLIFINLSWSCRQDKAHSGRYDIESSEIESYKQQNYVANSQRKPCP